MCNEESATRATRLNRTGRGDVVRRDAMTEHSQHTRVANIREFAWFLGHFVEKRWALNISGFCVPGVQITFRHLQSAPALIAFKNLAVLLEVHIRAHRLAHGLFDFFWR